MERNHKNFLYKKYLNSEGFKTIGSHNKRMGIVALHFLICGLCLASGVLSSFLGFPFNNSQSIFASFINLIPLTGALIILGLIFSLNNKCNFYQKQKYIFLLFLPFFLLTIAIVIFTVLTQEIRENSIGESELVTNVFPLICIYLPLYIGYFFFFWNVTIKGFGIIDRENENSFN